MTATVPTPVVVTTSLLLRVTLIPGRSSTKTIIWYIWIFRCSCLFSTLINPNDGGGYILPCMHATGKKRYKKKKKKLFIIMASASILRARDLCPQLLCPNVINHSCARARVYTPRWSRAGVIHRRASVAAAVAYVHTHTHKYINIICIGSIHARANVGGRDGRTYVLYYYCPSGACADSHRRLITSVCTPPWFYQSPFICSIYIYIYIIFLHPVYYYCIYRQRSTRRIIYTCTAHVHAFVYNTAATASAGSVCPSPCESSRSALYCCCAYCIYNATSATDTAVTNSINNLNKLMGYNKSSVSHCPLPPLSPYT